MPGTIHVPDSSAAARPHDHRRLTEIYCFLFWIALGQIGSANPPWFERSLVGLELYAHIKSQAPRVSVDFNYHGSPPFSFEVGQRPVQHAQNADFVTGETGVWGFSALGVSLNAQFYRAATPKRPVQVAIQRSVRTYHDQTTRPLHDIRWELFTLLAHGAFVTMVDKTAFDGWLDPVAYERIGLAFAEAQRKRGHFGHQPVYDVGLYFSSRTRDWIGREDAARYWQSFYGAHKACVLEHFQFGVLLDENVSLNELQRFPVVCLPNVAILSRHEVAQLRGYVEQGGKLLVTGYSGQFDRWGKPLAESALSELIGATVTRRLDSMDNWLNLENGADSPSASHRPASGSSVQVEGCATAAPALPMLARDLPTGWPFLVEGPATLYAPTTAVPVGALLEPHRTARQRQGTEGLHWPMSADAPVGAAILIHRLGQGLVLTFAGSPDFATAGEHAIVEARVIFRNAIRLLQPTPRVEIAAPTNVEAIVTDDPAARKLRLHFVAYNPTPQTTPPRNRPYVIPGLIEDVPIFRVAVKLAEIPRTVTAGNESTVLHWHADSIEATIEDIHEVLVLDY